MTRLVDARAELATALTGAGYTVHPSVPENIAPPCVVLQPADPYLSAEETTFDPLDWLVTLDLFVLADYRSNEQAADTLDVMLTAVVPAIAAADWEVAIVGAPGPYTTSEWIAHGIRLRATRYVTIEGDPA